jgi:hypothetical protein
MAAESVGHVKAPNTSDRDKEMGTAAEGLPPDHDTKSNSQQEERQTLSIEKANIYVNSYLEKVLGWNSFESDKWEKWTWRLQLAILCTSFLVTITAAFPTSALHISGAPESYLSHDYLKWIVVILSSLTTLLTGILTRSGVERTAELRELARVKLETLKHKTLLKLTMMPMSERDRLDLLLKVVDAIEDIEEKYGINPLVSARAGGRTPRE